ncbi:MAG TPA: YfiR family protein [Terriglobia bacterium]|nr:YfiR family protein [Terriglobia bacterium]
MESMRETDRSMGSYGDACDNLPFLRLWLVVSISVLALIGSTTTAPADSPAFSEYQVKAAFLYNFARFVEWPSNAFPDAQAPILLGVIGEDPFGGALEQVIKGKTVNGRELVLKRLTRQQDLKGFHMLFVSSSEARHLSQIMESLKGKCVLTIGETEGFAQTGGVINFTLEENKVHFEINVDTAERAHLKISSKLLALAKVLKDEHPDARK